MSGIIIHCFSTLELTYMSSLLSVPAEVRVKPAHPSSLAGSHICISSVLTTEIFSQPGNSFNAIFFPVSSLYLPHIKFIPPIHILSLEVQINMRWSVSTCNPTSEKQS